MPNVWENSKPLLSSDMDASLLRVISCPSVYSETGKTETGPQVTGVSFFRGYPFLVTTDCPFTFTANKISENKANPFRKTGLIFVLQRRRNGWTKWRHLKSVGLRHRKTSATKVEEVNTTITRDLGTNAVSTLRAPTGACGQHASENGSVKSRLGQLQDPSAVGRH
ncbi:hypothetical protein J6590_034007 [Homalodisca vitripennis]|nr:hypothetical protein J6590_034007 [Homalodisca vitripennis]